MGCFGGELCGFNVRLEERLWANTDGLGFIPKDDPLYSFESISFVCVYLYVLLRNKNNLLDYANNYSTKKRKLNNLCILGCIGNEIYVLYVKI